MEKQEINKLISAGKFLNVCDHPELVETHISWVILCNRFVYKVKQPMKYSFLDFSTLKKRKYFCEKELKLNQRLTENMYLDIQPVRQSPEGINLGLNEGEIIDYAVRMRRMDEKKQMDVLLSKNKVSGSDIQNIAQQIAAFHLNACCIYKKEVRNIQKKFNALAEQKSYLYEHLGAESRDIIDKAVEVNMNFIGKHNDLLLARLRLGFFRDVHGDLHSRNIFLLPEPVIFDCIEFNDDYRQIDVLNEVAFLCMDLEAFGRPDLSKLFIKTYNNLFPCMQTKEEKSLFIYYKCYRANVRAKVNSLRSKNADNEQRKKALAETEKYLRLMDSYVSMLLAE
ncbi:hypothetical protein [Solitalea koreensis]|uniref:Aminoglycoside phosphotransferase domain-containing protein n=1 Tax=Solitalea koreensis TaxID=543615 RepID=A0A521DDR7_9SPHI|nr:hypothetical protein [Solitalea koreensis]SMO69793.1 hypothetical protein SAMN06265350_106221 [Solitalea koreensis]